MRDTPFPAFDVPSCLARNERHSWYGAGACDVRQSAALNPAIFQSENIAARNLTHIHFVDMTDNFCTNGVCASVSNGSPVYRDDNHMYRPIRRSIVARSGRKATSSLAHGQASGASNERLAALN